MSASPAINSTESSPEVVISSQVSLNYDPVHLEALSEFHIPQSLVKHMADRDSDHLSFGEMPFTSSPAAEAVESKVQPIADDEPGLTITNTFNLSTTSLDQIVCPVPFENETQDSKHQVGEDQITPITLQVVQRDNGEIDPLSLCESKDDVVITMAKNVKASSIAWLFPVTTTAELPYSQIKKQEPKIIPTEPSSLQKRVHPVESEVVFEICDETRQDSNDIEHRLFSILVQSGFPNHAVAPFIKALESRGYVIESTSLTPYRLSGIFKPKSKKHTKLRFLVRMDNNSSVLTNEEIADILFKIVKGPSSETSRWRGMRAASAFFKKAFSSIAKKFRRENRSA
ncbi:hypothetical protein BC829DRAFT_397845 [Chytridium lagenaria]|nr:hypothetical protein BC829DRAFT_397845 [Chytridium lagenaria]